MLVFGFYLELQLYVQLATNSKSPYRILIEKSTVTSPDGNKNHRTKPENHEFYLGRFIVFICLLKIIIVPDQIR